MQWIQDSDYITVEDKNVDLRDWRKQLNGGRLKTLMDQMKGDLDQARSIQKHKKKRVTKKESNRCSGASS